MNDSHCYLLHFSDKVCHSGHYLGTSADLCKRLQMHGKNTSRAKLIQRAHELGITFQLVRVWDGGRGVERHLKDRHDSPKLCPICNPHIHLTEDEEDEVSFYGNYLVPRKEVSNG